MTQAPKAELVVSPRAARVSAGILSFVAFVVLIVELALRYYSNSLETLFPVFPFFWVIMGAYWLLRFAQHREDNPRTTSLTERGIKSTARKWDERELAWDDIVSIRPRAKFLPLYLGTAKVLFRDDQGRLATLNFHVENENKLETEQFQTVLNHFWSDWQKPKPNHV